ncbi:hypothetical protein D6C84_04470 [Aureobasidium pullulans]|uniref:Uncharacterized protein n=1 Tax=Aureobasidium pullulans TaxID=5580 RepID=A0A4S9XXB2_AURPU|nr:hypothetical protein D6C84_04470 [Aureobasidium pullulans]
MSQLLHYGLPPSKDKNTAKVRLLQAINAGTLAVPDHVNKLEKEMKKEFVAAAKKAKAAEETTIASIKGKKRTHEEATTNTKVTLIVGGITISVDQQTAASITSAATAVPSAAKKYKATKTAADTTSAKPKKTKDDVPAPKARKPVESAATTESKSSNAADKPVSKTTTAKSQEKAVSTKPKVASKPKDPTTTAKPKATPRSKDAPPAPEPKAEPKTKKPVDTNTVKHLEPPKQTARTVQQEGLGGSRIKSESGKDINGTYWLHLRSRSPANVPDFNGPPRISIHRDVNSNKLWGHSTIGSKTGVLRIETFLLENTSVCDFDWRARDMGTDQQRFGRGCEGMMEFGIHGLERGTFHRVFDGLDVEFGVSTITRDTRMDWPEWMDQWEDFVKKAYNR